MRRSSERPRGASLIEFLIGVVGVLLPLVLAILQIALLTVTRQQLNLATQLAARAAAVDHGSLSTVRTELARGLTPLFGDKRSMSQAGAVLPVVTAQALALAEVLRPDLTHVDVLNPTRESFQDFELLRDGVRAIPNGPFEPPTRVGAASGQTLQDANTLSLRVTYCARLIVPLVDRLIPALLAVRVRDPRDLACYAARRLPMTARAMITMHSAPRRQALGL